jgi:hypothetical protein
LLARLKARLTYANVVATLALFFALGGSAYAVATIGSRDVKDRSLRGIDVQRNTLTGTEIKEGSLGQVKRSGTALTAVNAANAANAAKAVNSQFANTAGTATLATNSQALDGLGSGVFERSSRTQFGSGSANPPTPASEGLLLEWDALGVRITAPAQGGCSPVDRITLHAVNTNASGPDLHLYAGASSDIALTSGSATIACSSEPRRWIGAVTRDGDARTLFFTCQRLGADVRCIGTRSEP